MATSENKAARFWQNRRNMVLMAVVCTFLWGCAFPAVKKGYELFRIGADDVPGQLVFAGVRFFTAGVVTLLVAWAVNRAVPKLSGRQIPGAAALGLLQTGLQYFFFYVGLAHTTGVRGSILNATSTFITVLLVGILWRKTEPLTSRKVIGCLLGFGGVLLVNLGGDMSSQPLTLLGDGFVLFSATASALSNLLTKVVARDIDAMTLTGWHLAIGGLALLVVGLLMGGGLTPSGPVALLLLAYMVFISTVAFTIWTSLLKYNPVSKVAVYNFLIPVFGASLSSILLGEGFPGLVSLGALVLVCLGIIIVNKTQK